MGSSETTRPWYRSPYLWAFVLGIGLLSLMRPLLRFDPDPPAVGARLGKFELIDAEGQRFPTSRLEGRVWVCGFVYTRCGSSCSEVVAALEGLAQRYDDAGIDDVRLALISVDPAFDTPERLRSFAERHGVGSDRWTLLTGSPDEVRELVTEGFGVALGQPHDTPAGGVRIQHPTDLVLVDASRNLRGVYYTDDLGLDEIFHRSLHVLGRRP